MVVEDNSINRTIAKAMLERIGFAVDFAEEEITRVERFISSRFKTYNVFYMDIQMPVMDGYEATRHILESIHSEAAVIPIVAMTADVFSEDIEKALTAGIDACVCKPIVLLELIEQTKKAMHK